MTVDFKSNVMLRMAFRMINADNSTMVNWQEASDYGKDADFTHSIKEPGWYYIEVANHADARGSVLPYQLILTTK